MIKTSNGVYPGTPLSIEEKRKKLYHFTSYKNFQSIWSSKELWFSSVDRVNDIVEASKRYRAFNPFQIKKVADEVRSYKQISFIMDFDSYLNGAMSNTMWGHYGDSGKGVCIEFDYEAIVSCKDIIHKDITYVDHFKIMDIPPDITNEEMVDNYVRENEIDLFFTKTKHWRDENEYRVLSKILNSIDITSAISGVYITSLFAGEGLLGEEFEVLNGMLGEAIPIYEYLFQSSEGKLIPSTGEARVIRQQLLDARNNKDNILNHPEDFFTDPFEKEK